MTVDKNVVVINITPSSSSLSSSSSSQPLLRCLNLSYSLSPSYPYSRGARLLNGVKRGALLAPKEVVIKNSISFLSVCLFKNGETKTAVVGPLVYVVLCKKLGFERKHVAKDATPS